ncbi:hypothetical protein DUGA6_56030 [Duganella sp. HH105]|nr:hypothetical protein DUGA6_56030 [Duganella sp. HH105]
MRMNWKLIVACLPIMAAAYAAAPDGATKLELPVEKNLFNVYSMEFSPDGKRVCLAATVSTEMGASKGRVLLIDRAHNALLWQADFAAPDSFAAVFPVQCAVSGDRVYVLANVDTDSSPPNSKTHTYVYSFDGQGRKVAYQRLPLKPRAYGYAMDSTADGVKVAGYIRDEDADSEYYSVYTLALSPELKVQGEPVIRKSGAYAQSVRARIVGDSLYATGMFYPAKTSKKDLIDDFAASRLRLNGGYAWSTHSGLGARFADVFGGVAADGTIYTLAVGEGSTSVLAVAPGGKSAPLVKYASHYCDTGAIAAWGKGVIAVRESCGSKAKDRSKANALVIIDPVAGKESVLDWVREEPQFAATHGSAWAVLAKDKSRRLYFYSAAGGQ